MMNIEIQLYTIVSDLFNKEFGTLFRGLELRTDLQLDEKHDFPKLFETIAIVFLLKQRGN